jgi:AcrR family transcriptional regulator
MARRTRDREQTRARILEVAFEEIYRRGFQGVGVREIAAAAGVTTGAFFHHFPSKNDVGYAIIDEILKVGILERWITPLATYENPVEAIHETFRRTFEEWPEEYLSRGCPLNNLAQEMSAVDAGFRERARGVIRLWIERTREHLERARRDGYLRADVDTTVLAEFIVSLQEGTFAMGKTLNDRSIYGSLHDSLRIHMEALSA